MKNFFTLSIIFFSSYALFGQSFAIYDENQEEVTNQTVDILVHVTSPKIETQFEVMNITDGDKIASSKRYELQCTEGSAEYYCWTLCLNTVECGNAFIREMPFGDNVPANGFFPTGLIVDFDPSYNSDEDAVEGESIYTYTIYDVNNPGDSAFVNVRYVVDANVSVDEQEAVSFSRIYPNPAQNEIRFTTSKPLGKAQFEIYSLIGERVHSINESFPNGEVILDVSILQPGVYLISELNTGITQRFIKSK